MQYELNDFLISDKFLIYVLFIYQKLQESFLFYFIYKILFFIFTFNVIFAQAVLRVSNDYVSISNILQYILGNV